MPKILNLNGPMAAGKTTITEILHKKLKTYSYVDRSHIKKKLKPSGRNNARKISKKASYLLIKELMKLKKNILTQEVNPTDLKKKLRPYFKDYNLKSFYIYCKLDTAIKRDIKRTKKTRSHLVRIIHSRYNGPEKGEIPINTDEMSVKQSVDLILKEIRKP